MGWNSIHGEPLPERSLFRDSDREVDDLSCGIENVVGAFGDQVLHVAQQVGMSLYEDDRTGGTELLVRVADEHDVARQLDS